jgi:ABC-2 type transport system ATP-binding protein
MADVTALAGRILMIESGNLMYDGDLHALVEKHTPHKFLHLSFEKPVDGNQFTSLGGVPASEVGHSEDRLKITLRVDRTAIKQAAAYALSDLPVTDVTIEDPPIEDIIRLVFHQGQAGPAPVADHEAQNDA